MTTMKSWAALLLVVVLLPRVAAAQDIPVPPDIPPGEDVTVGLELGRPAPFRGVLIDVDTSIRQIHRLEWYEFRLRLEIESGLALRTALEESYRRELEGVRSSYEREIEGLRADLREQAATMAAALQPDPFWETPGFGFIMGVLLSAVLVGVAALLMVQL
jgi:hypothetical protein